MPTFKKSKYAKKKYVTEFYLFGVGDLRNCPDAFAIATCFTCGTPFNLAELPRCSCKGKGGKTHAKTIRVNGYKFDSISEGRRYSKLTYAERLGIIERLQLQPIFEFDHMGKVFMKYIADFVYWFDNNWVVEDVKGYETEGFKLKKRMLKVWHPEIDLALAK